MRTSGRWVKRAAFHLDVAVPLCQFRVQQTLDFGDEARGDEVEQGGAAELPGSIRRRRETGPGVRQSGGLLVIGIVLNFIVVPALPPTSDALLDAEHRPYFLWWLDCSVGELRQHLVSGDPELQAYYLGALLREANTRDVWLFTTPEQVRASWPRVARHLGESRARWQWLLGLSSS